MNIFAILLLNVLAISTVAANWKKQARDLVFVIDGSEEMGKVDFKKMLNAISSVINTTDIDQEQDRVAILSFGKFRLPKLILENMNKSLLLERINQSNGTVRIYSHKAAFSSALNIFKQHGRSDVNSVIVFITKSLPEHWGTVYTSLVTANQRYIRTFSIGVGNTTKEFLHYIHKGDASKISIATNINLLQDSLKATLNNVDTNTPLVYVFPKLKRDIVFVIEGTEQMGNENFNKTLDIIESIINTYYEPDRDYYSLISYGKYGVPQLNLDRLSKSLILERFQQKNKVPPAGTTLKSGYSAALDMLETNRRSNAMPVIVFIIASQSEPINSTANEKSRANILDVKRFSIGVSITSGFHWNHLNSDLLRYLCEEPDRVRRSEISYLKKDVEYVFMLLDKVTPSIIPTTVKRDIIFVIEGSQDTTRENIRKTFRGLTSVVNQIEIGYYQNRIATIAYGYAGIYPITLTRDKFDIVELLTDDEDLRRDRKSDLNQGLQAALDMSYEHGRLDALQAIVLLTSKPEIIPESKISSAYRDGAMIFPILIGPEINDEYLLYSKEYAARAIKIDNYSSIEFALIDTIKNLDTAISTKIARQKDIVFVIDGTPAVGQSNFDKIISAISSTLGKIYIEPKIFSRLISLLSYGTIPVPQHRLTFDNATNSSRLERIGPNAYGKIYGTTISDGLKGAALMFNRLGRPKSSKIVLSIHVSAPNTDSILIQERNKILQSAKIFSFGIGSAVTNNDLLLISGDQTRTRKLDNFNTLADAMAAVINNQ